MPAWGVQIRYDTITPKLTGFTARMRRNITDRFDVVGADMVDLARSLVRVKTGALRDSIYHRVADLELEFGASIDYALPQEFGTYKMVGQPYMRPALDANQEKILDAVLVGCMEALDV